MQIGKLNIFLLLLCIVVDFVLFFKGFTYRYFFYENLLILLPPGHRFFSVIILVLVNYLKFLHIYFAVNIFALLPFGIYQNILTIMIPIFIVAVLYLRLKLLLFASLLGLTVFADKFMAVDRLSTSILYTQYHSAFFKPSSLIYSEVYDAIKLELSNKNVILINWESLGVPKDKTLADKITNKHENLQYSHVKVGSRSTLASELEYLCQQSFGVLNVVERCLPNNVTSIAIHGNTKYFFNRAHLYQKIGFQEFIDRSEFAGQKTCFYSFLGICDEELFRKVMSLAAESKYNFIYALTLDSHYPYMKYQQHAPELYAEVEDVLELLSSCCSDKYTVVVVGDHPPPLSNEFLQEVVPFFILK